ncbi:MAG: hypothetical protein A3C55_04140 [Gammaproteobacteria bacterium RIFCSPHIGHO2_02_FULL_42_13]|nr:MAG: hypothetical protein A3C55_04140 [Gammaproteobacteria bacterium RIFCSPHIGHO2_02_FULL_42_13]
MLPAPPGNFVRQEPIKPKKKIYVRKITEKYSKKIIDNHGRWCYQILRGEGIDSKKGRMVCALNKIIL